MSNSRDMSGALFKNDKREKDSHPLYKGDCTINGQKFWISAWLKEGKNGKYMSLSFRQAEQRTDDRQDDRRDWQRPAEADPF